MQFAEEKGIVSMIGKICDEYNQTKKLEPLKVCILGPTASGKSTIARQISDLYRLSHFTREDIITTSLDLMKEVVSKFFSREGLAGEDADEQAAHEAKSILAAVDKMKVAAMQGTDDAGDLSGLESEVEGPPQRKSLTPPETDVTKMNDALFIRTVRWRLLTTQCQNQGFILDGFPENMSQAKALFSPGEGDELDEEEEDEGKETTDSRLVPDRVVVLEASDEFLTRRLQSIPVAQLQEKHKEKTFLKTLAEYRDRNSVYERTFLFYLDLQEIVYHPIDITTVDGQLMQNVISKLMDILGKPRNYGLTKEEEDALRDSQNIEKSKIAEAEKEDESREIEERRANIQQWMEKLAKVKREEFEREEAALLPIRHYLMAHVVPTLTKGLIDVTRARPDDPVEYLAEYLFSNNPGSLNTTLGDKFPAPPPDDGK